MPFDFGCLFRAVFPLCCASADCQRRHGKSEMRPKTKEVRSQDRYTLLACSLALRLHEEILRTVVSCTHMIAHELHQSAFCIDLSKSVDINTLPGTAAHFVCLYPCGPCGEIPWLLRQQVRGVVVQGEVAHQDAPDDPNAAVLSAVAAGLRRFRRRDRGLAFSDGAWVREK